MKVAFRAESSNHVHIVLRTLPDVVQSWSDEEVVGRWLKITRLVKSKGGKMDVSGRIVREGKFGLIPKHLAPILMRLGIQVDLWSGLVTDYHEWFGNVAAASQKLIDHAALSGRSRYRGQPQCGEAFG